MSVAFKKQKLGNLASAGKAEIQPTKYESDPATLLNFPSSVMNGVTLDGGLQSLTFKSISCHKLVENLDNMRKLLVSSDNSLELSDMNNTTSELQALLESLQGHAEQSPEDESPATQFTPSEIAGVNADLDNFRANKADFAPITVKMRSVYGGSSLQETPQAFTNPQSWQALSVEIPGVEITSMNDVENLDMLRYENSGAKES